MSTIWQLIADEFEMVDTADGKQKWIRKDGANEQIADAVRDAGFDLDLDLDTVYELLCDVVTEMADSEQTEGPPDDGWRTLDYTGDLLDFQRKVWRNLDEWYWDTLIELGMPHSHNVFLEWGHQRTLDDVYYTLRGKLESELLCNICDEMINVDADDLELVAGGLICGDCISEGDEEEEEGEE